MPAAYTRSVQFEASSTTPVCVRVNVPFRGRLTRFVLEQVGGTAIAAKVKLYDRRGACSVANDVNVRLSGEVDTVTTHIDGSQVLFTEPHGLFPGDRIEVKTCSVDAYNTTHIVLAVIDDSTIVSNVSYDTSDGAGGYWQTPPFLTTRAPSTHLLLQDDVYPNSPIVRLDIDRPYENRDNQNELTRLLNDALWLEFTPLDDEGVTLWELGYTVYPASYVA